MATYRTQRLYSRSLPSDWDSDDDEYVEMVEKAKSRNRKIAKIGPYIAPTAWTAVGALQGGLIGSASGTKGADIGATAGAAGGLVDHLASKKILEGYLKSKGIKPKSYQELSDRDQKAADRAIGHYRNMKTKEERLAWRKKIGSRV